MTCKSCTYIWVITIDYNCVKREQTYLRIWIVVQTYSVSWTTDPLRTMLFFTRSLSWIAIIAYWDDTESESSKRYLSCAVLMWLMSNTCSNGFRLRSPASIAGIPFDVRFTGILNKFRSEIVYRVISIKYEMMSGILWGKIRVLKEERI